MNDDDTVSKLRTLTEQMSAVCRAAGRDPASAHLIAVSKTYDADVIRPVLAAGHRAFGENRVQEAQAKWPVLKSEFAGVELHLIGPLQSNKAADAVALFDAIHTIDRLKIAQAIAAEITKQNKQLQLFVQVNTGAESQKAGVAPDETVAFVGHCRDVLALPITGLMCIPPIKEEPAVHFAFLAKLAREANLPNLSMGMSSDYRTALQFGATHIRVGSAIFGARG
jgi:PLP dependent protein